MFCDKSMLFRLMISSVFNSKASFDKKYIRLLELLEENNRLKKIVQGIAIIDKHNIPSRKK